MDKNIDETSIETLISYIKCSIFRTYYQIISNQFKMKLFFILFLILDALQNMSLILFNISLSNYSQSNYSQTVNLISIVRQLVTLYKSNDFISGCVCLYTTFLFLIIQIGTLFYYAGNDICYKTKKNFMKQLFFKILLILNIFYQTIFMIPIFTTILSMFQCQSTKSSFVMINYNEIVCNSTIFYINIVIASLTFLLFLFISLINAVFLNDNIPVSNIPWSAPKSHVALISVAFKLVLSFFYTFEFGTIQYYFKNIIVIGLTILLGVNKIYIPLYHIKIVFDFNVFFKGMLIFMSLISFINTLLSTNYTNEIVIVIIITSIFFGGLFLAVSFKIKEYYTYTNVSNLC